MIYLKHTIHGHKIATLEAEAAADEKNGWERYVPAGKKVSPLETPVEYANNMDAKRRGRARVLTHKD
jgi:hypothetical protein